LVDGFNRDRIVAHALINLAKLQGNQLAAHNLKKLEADMSPLDTERAQSLARDMSMPGRLDSTRRAYLKASHAPATAPTAPARQGARQ
jgi:hypothetical protein